VGKGARRASLYSFSGSVFNSHTQASGVVPQITAILEEMQAMEFMRQHLLTLFLWWTTSGRCILLAYDLEGRHFRGNFL